MLFLPSPHHMALPSLPCWHKELQSLCPHKELHALALDLGEQAWVPQLEIRTHLVIMAMLANILASLEVRGSLLTGPNKAHYLPHALWPPTHLALPLACDFEELSYTGETRSTPLPLLHGLDKMAEGQDTALISKSSLNKNNFKALNPKCGQGEISPFLSL